MTTATATSTIAIQTSANAMNDRPGVYGKIAGLYDLEETLGVGHFAVVKLARHVFTGEKVAVKVIDKTKLDDVSRAHLFQEVRCMKLVQHPNVVRLYEVIDTQTKLYLILELGDGGDLYDYIMKHDDGLNENSAREYFRQMVRAISYCHQLHVVHRDLKPENVLFFEKLGIIKLTDFGFSNKFCPGQKLETSCGSLAYSAPEILLGDSYDAPAVDVWSLGVILYMLVCGHLPFQEANDSETLTMIMDCKYATPAHVSNDCRHLIGRMLLREPEQRATLDEIAHHTWLTQDGADCVPEHLPLVSREQVSDDDHTLIIQKMVNGNIATKEDILEALDKDEYNHITATYFLLAERRLKVARLEQAQLQRSLAPLASKENATIKITTDTVDGPNDARITNLLLPPSNVFYNNSRLAPSDTTTTTGRTRKCSIVQEEDLDEDEADGERDDSSLNRRGSRSEGRINITVQDRLAESERLKKDGAIKVATATSNTTSTVPSAPARSIFEGISNVKVLKPSDMDTNRLGRMRILGPKFTPLPTESMATAIPKPADLRLDTSIDEVDQIGKIDDCDRIKFLVDAATVQLPSSTQPSVAVPPKFKTMPSPTRANTILPGAMCLNEIFEEGTDIGSSDTSATATPRLMSRHTAFTNARASGGSHRRAKFHKSRTTSCSSSDDDDSESRKKRAHKMVDSTKPFPAQRRDSNDDSSDSQEPNPTCGGGSGTIQTVTVHITASNGSSDGGAGGSGATAMETAGQSTDTASGRQRSLHGFRRHRTGRCRNNEIRLRESQSLNRITEVQDEDRLLSTSTQHPNRSPALSTGAIEQNIERSASPSIASAQSIIAPQPIISKPKSFGARLLAGFKRNTNSDGKQSTNTKATHDTKTKHNNNNDASKKVPCNGKQRTIAAVESANPISWIKNSKPPLRVKAQQRFKNLKCLVDIFS